MRGARALFPREVYPLDAVYAGLYTFLDRAWLFLEPTEDGVAVHARSKDPTVADHVVLGQLGNELLAQAYRLALAKESRPVVEAIATFAIAGAAGQPGLDELLEMEIGDATAFEDPLGIAMSWEEKYGKKADKKEDP